MSNNLDGGGQVKKITETWKNLTKEISKTVDELKEFNKNNQKLPSDYLKSLEQLKTVQKEYEEALAKVNGTHKQYVANLKEEQRINKLLQSTKAKLEKATSKEAKELNKLRIELAALNKAQKQDAILTSKMTTEYQKLVVRMNQAGASVQSLNAKKAQGSALSKSEQIELKRSTKDFNRYQNAVLKADKSIGRFQRNVGNYPKGLIAAAGAARQFASALELVGGAFLFVQVMRNAIGVMRDYEKQNATLAGVLQKSKSETKELREESARLGSETVKTASEVTGLQIEYARLGFSQQQIIELTEATIQGSIAMNSELGQTAGLVGAVVNTFDDLSASDAPKIIDILSLSTAKSALNFSKLETGIPIVAGAANAAGIPFTKLVALMGKLSDSGIDVSTSSTALRNIFIESASQGLNYEQILEKIKKSQDKLTSANDEFGKRAAVSSAILAENIDQTNELDEALQKAAGTAEGMAKKELDTLDGSIKLITSAWEGFVLSMDDSNGASLTLKDTIAFLAKNLSTILNTIIKVGKAFLIYKAVVLGVSLVTRAYSAIIVGLRIAKIALAGGIGKATTAMKLFNVATKANPAGLLIGAIAAGIGIFLAFRDGVKETSQAFIDLKRNADLATEAIVKNTLAKVNEQLRAIDEEIDNEKKANAKKLELINQNIKDQKDGTATLFSEVEEIEKVESEKSVKTLNEKLSNNKALWDQYYRDLEALAKGQTTVQPTPPESQEFTLSEQSQIDKSHSVRTEAEKTLIVELEKIRLKLLRSLNKKTNNEAVDAQKKLNKDIFNLEKSRLERIIKITTDSSKDENEILFNRNLNHTLSLGKRLELLDLEEKEAVRLAGKRTKKIIKIQEEFNFKRKQLEETAIKERAEILLSDYNKRVSDFKSFQAKQNNEVKKAENILIESLLDRGKKTEEIDREVTKLRNKEFKKQLQSQIKFLSDELMAFAITVDKKAELESELSKLRSKLNSILIEERRLDEEDEKARLERVKAEIQDAFSSIGNILGVSGENLGTIFNGIVNGFENVGEAAKSFGQLATEIFSSVAEFQRKQIEGQINLLEKEKALQLSGIANTEETKAAREEIERQFQERRAQLLTKQAKTEKATAISSSIINTAVAVTKALSTGNIPLSITVGIIGAAKTALIAAQQIPQFKDGVRNFEGGQAILGDGGVSEIVRTPDGNVFKTPSKDTLYNLPKGTDVFKNENEFERELDKMLNFNGVFRESQKPDIHINNNGITKNDLSNHAKRIENAIGTSKGGQIIFDEKGYRKFQTKKNTRTQILNNRFTITSKSV